MDRIVKVREYAAVPSIRRYVILESTSVGLTVLERAAPDQVWQTTVLTNDDTLRMPEINIDIPVPKSMREPTSQIRTKHRTNNISAVGRLPRSAPGRALFR